MFLFQKPWETQQPFFSGLLMLIIKQTWFLFGYFEAAINSRQNMFNKDTQNKLGEKMTFKQKRKSKG